MLKSEFDKIRLFIASDIGREVELAKATEVPEKKSLLEDAGVLPGGGNFLAALGLLCYTEFAGGLKGDPNAKTSTAQFETFFRDLGPAYERLLKDGHKIYDIFRCGLAHEYWVKLSCTIDMLDGGKSGVRYDPTTKHWTFSVETYLRDFLAAFDKLRPA